MVNPLGIMALVVVLASCANNSTQQERDPIELAGLYTEMGLAYLQRGENERARERLEKALNLDPKSANARHYLAEVYNRLGQVESADKSFLQALELTPQDPNLQNNYGAFLCGKKRYEEALRYFKQAADNREYRTPFLAYENAGRCLVAAQRYDEAEGFLKQALEQQSKLPNSLFGMAELLYQKRHYLKARAYLERYLEVGATSPEVLWLAIQIEGALNDQQAVAKYGEQLTKQHADSAQAKKFLQMGKRSAAPDGGESMNPRADQ